MSKPAPTVKTPSTRIKDFMCTRSPPCDRPTINALKRLINRLRRGVNGIAVTQTLRIGWRDGRERLASRFKPGINPDGRFEFRSGLAESAQLGKCHPDAGVEFMIGLTKWQRFAVSQQRHFEVPRSRPIIAPEVHHL